MELDKKTKLITDSLEEKKGADIIVMDAPEGLLLDKFVVCSANNTQHLKTLFENLKKTLSDNNIDIYGAHGPAEKESGWLVLDTSDIIIHIMTSEKREYYTLEELWKESFGEKSE
ncbi:MAG: ribosome silencing factor [Candidatus Muiribacterium halophilum]|uniref:Ribosomal silencing factor RsfS n=1 Tax=Muiribacterium halophilum TaxID=2053465 RepID=A0A2N5ZC30_MUIH1|nr:MAG: ribosome silencing factor [Candidatus Muirbacterium halophilum]